MGLPAAGLGVTQVLPAAIAADDAAYAQTICSALAPESVSPPTPWRSVYANTGICRGMARLATTSNAAMRSLSHSVRGSGQQRLYSLSSDGLKPIHDWAGQFKRFWSESFVRLTDDLDELQREEKSDEHPD